MVGRVVWRRGGGGAGRGRGAGQGGGAWGHRRRAITEFLFLQNKSSTSFISLHGIRDVNSSYSDCGEIGTFRFIY